MEVNLKSLLKADAKPGPDCNTGETISSIVISLDMFHSVQLQYSLFKLVQQFSISQYTGLGLSQRLRCKHKNTLVSAERECLQLLRHLARRPNTGNPANASLPLLIRRSAILGQVERFRQ
jgi:hypothetical protein